MSRRYDDQARGFPAFPPGTSGARRGQSWWGRAWVRAMEETALDPEPLRKGRRYASAGHVGTITISPGRIAAPVYGSDPTPYRTVVFVEQLTGAEWERFLDEVAAKAGHIAALLDKDMPHDLVEAAEDAGVRLLPGAGDLEPECSCPNWEHPCKHAAALCYQASWLLDEDPFVLLLMRGRGEQELLAELQRLGGQPIRRTAPAPPVDAGGPALETPVAQPPVAGTPAQQAYARDVPPLPDPPPLAAGSGPLLAVQPAPGVDPDALRLLAADAAVRARELLAAEDCTEPPPVPDGWQDAVRRAATHPDGRLFARLQQASGRPEELARAVQAWRYGGPAGLDVLERMWSPPRTEFARARAALAAGWEGEDPEEPPPLRVQRNRWTVTGRGLQLRYGRDGRWYPYRMESGEWWPAGPPERDPAVALAELLAG